MSPEVYYQLHNQGKKWKVFNKNESTLLRTLTGPEYFASSTKHFNITVISPDRTMFILKSETTNIILNTRIFISKRYLGLKFF